MCRGKRAPCLPCPSPSPFPLTSYTAIGPRFRFPLSAFPLLIPDSHPLCQPLHRGLLQQ